MMVPAMAMFDVIIFFILILTMTAMAIQNSLMMIIASISLLWRFMAMPLPLFTFQALQPRGDHSLDRAANAFHDGIGGCIANGKTET